MATVKVTARPNKFPWVEGVDYHVQEGEPQVGDIIRVRDERGERFELVQAAFPSPSAAPAILSKRTFIDMAAAALGTNGEGRAALGAILRGMNTSDDDEVYVLSQRWTEAITLDKPQVSALTSILVSKNIMTSQQRTAILNAWPNA